MCRATPCSIIRRKVNDIGIRGDSLLYLVNKGSFHLTTSVFSLKQNPLNLIALK